jgi:hypothetical protein
MRVGTRMINTILRGCGLLRSAGQFPAKQKCMNKPTDILIEVPGADICKQGGNYANFYRAIPRNGEICPFSGLKHARLYKLLSEGGVARAHVRVVQLKEPGAAKGVTLFHVGDLMQFLDRLAAEQGSGRPGAFA